MISIINTILYFIHGAFARRWFGGALEGDKLLKYRGLQTAYMLLLFLSIYITDFSVETIIIGTVISLWLQFQFWSRGHGCCFDIGRGDVTPETIARYNERWYHYVLDYIYNKLNKEKYTKSYDFWYMAMRYGCPMLPMCWFSWWYLAIGMIPATVYAISWKVYDYKPEWFKAAPEWMNSPTRVSEIIVGGIVFSGCSVILYGI